MKFAKPTAANWARWCEEEAKRLGYRIEYVYENDMITASFWNGEIHCFDHDRSWTP